MWPWDHVAIAYVVYSLSVRATGGRPPDVGVVVALVVGSQVPDLVDKPLGWILDVLPSGVSLAHSLLFAVPVCLAVVAWLARRGRPDRGVAFTVGYLLHLPADAFYPLVLGAEAKSWLFLWPLTPGEHSSPTSVTSHLLELLTRFGDVVFSPRGLAIVGIELALLATALLLWSLDGCPGRRLVAGRPRLSDP